MAANSRTVSVGTTATRLDTANDYAAKVGAAIANVGAVTVYIGGSGVTTAAGYPLAAGQQMAFDIGKGDELYGRVASGTCEVRVIEVGA